MEFLQAHKMSDLNQNSDQYISQNKPRRSNIQKRLESDFNPDFLKLQTSSTHSRSRYGRAQITLKSSELCDVNQNETSLDNPKCPQQTDSGSCPKKSVKSTDVVDKLFYENRKCALLSRYRLFSRYRILSLSNDNERNGVNPMISMKQTKEESQKKPVKQILNRSIHDLEYKKQILTKSRRKTFSAPSIKCSDALHDTFIPNNSTDGIRITNNISTYSIFKDEVLANRSLVDDEWLEGDIAWGRVGKHPFWPCLICPDPSTGSFVRISASQSTTPVKYLHVRFFGDSGRRSELKSHNLMPYAGLEDFKRRAEELSSDVKCKNHKNTKAFAVPPSKLSNWEDAVKEANEVIKQPHIQRLFYFNNTTATITQNISDIIFNNSTEQTDKLRIKMKKARSSIGSSSSESENSTVMPMKKQKVMEFGKTKENSDLEIICYSITPPYCVDKDKTNMRLAELHSQNGQELLISKHDNYENVRNTRSKVRQKNELFSKKLISDGTITNQELNVRDVGLRDTSNLDFRNRKSLQVSSNNVHIFEAADNIDTNGKNTLHAHINNNTEAEKAYTENNLGEETSLVNTKSQDALPLSKRISTSADERPENGNLITELNEVEISRSPLSCSVPSDRFEENGSVDKSRRLKRKRSSINTPSVRTDEENGDTTSNNSDDLPDKRKSNPKNKDTNASEITRRNPNRQVSARKTKSPLFRGLCRERVCPICEKPGQLLKCKGPCSNYYHYQCIQNQDKESKENQCASFDVNIFEQYAEKYMLELLNNSAQTFNLSQSSLQKQAIDNEMTEVDFNSSSQNTSTLTSRTDFKCNDCSFSRKPKCFICHNEDINTSSERHKCCNNQCGNFFHIACLKSFPQTQINLGSASSRKSDVVVDTFICPHHVCHTCVSDNPRGNKSTFLNDQLSKCIRCPTAYHTSIHCIPAGTVLLTSSQIICVKHFDFSKGKTKLVKHLNVNWCFICAVGGKLMCCETCPTAFHLDCLKVQLPEGGYICEDCEAGRYPLYDEVVWCKLGNYRWWPSRVLPPYEVPDKILQAKHKPGQFCVRFFGSFDHHWTNRARVFLYHEGDTTSSKSNGSQTDEMFVKAVSEASVACAEFKRVKDLHMEKVESDLKPPYYIKIKTNRVVGSVKSSEGDVSLVTPCECNPNSQTPCGPQSRCLNRVLLFECNPDTCPAGNRCCNQAFEKGEYPLLSPFKTKGKGWGLKTLVDINPGEFIVEYVGEIINNTEFHRRLERKDEEKDENYYFLTLDKDRIIDAGPKGNMARFINHSCDPNCETQKWNVNGDLRVGFFAINFIKADTELTFNYNFVVTGGEKKKCFCGTERCSGFIGAKKSEISSKAIKAKSKTKRM